MRQIGLLSAIALVSALMACQSKDRDQTASEPDNDSPIPVKPKKAPSESPNRKSARNIRIVLNDLTPASEKPANMIGRVRSLAEKAAKAAGFSIDKSGLLVGVEYSYGVIADGKVDANARKGLVVWNTQVTLSLEDELGLAEDIIGRVYGRKPFVRDALPSMTEALDEVLGLAIESAFRDVAMQLRYRSLPARDAFRGLFSSRREESWAALRRIGELGLTEAVPTILDLMSGADELTVSVAIGVLGRLKDPRAIDSLANAARTDEPVQAMAVVEALRQIGGKLARKVIREISTTHPDAHVCARAREILAATDE